MRARDRVENRRQVLPVAEIFATVAHELALGESVIDALDDEPARRELSEQYVARFLADRAATGS